MPKLYKNLEVILSRTHGNFEEQNIIIYCIIINVNYNYIVINVYSIIIVFLTKCSSRNAIKKVSLNRAATTACLKQKTVKRSVQCHVFAQSPPGRRPNDKYPFNTSHPSRFVNKCCAAVLLDSNDTTYIVCKQSDICVCVYIYIQGVTGGTDQTSGECSLGQTIPI